MIFHLTGLWHHAEFRKLWIAQIISVFGSAITEFALPLTAVLTLQATPVEMGLLRSVQFAPHLLVGLFAGVWVDRLQKQFILVGADLGRAILLSSIPLAVVFHLLRIEHLYIVAFCVGVLTVFFDVSYYAFLPFLVEHKQLIEGNSKLEASWSVAQIIGPGFAAQLVGLVTAPIAIGADTLSFLLSALFLIQIRTQQPISVLPSRSFNFWNELIEGIKVVFENPLLCSFVGCSSTRNFFDSVQLSVYILYSTHDLGISPSQLGVIFTISSCGALLGSLVAERVAQWFGLGPTIVWSAFIRGIGALLIPLASGSLVSKSLILSMAGFLLGLTDLIYVINQAALRQSVVSRKLQGRMTASMRFMVYGLIPVGSFLGGFLGERIGVRTTLLLGGIGTLFSFLWVFFSPLRSLRKLPAPIE